LGEKLGDKNRNSQIVRLSLYNPIAIATLIKHKNRLCHFYPAQEYYMGKRS